MPPPASRSCPNPRGGDHRQQLVAVDDLALLIDHHDTVGIAVERDADVGAHLAYLVDQRGGGGGADLAIDVEAVGVDADGDDLCTEFPQRLGGNLVGGAVSAVDHDAQAVECQVAGKRALGELDVAILHAVDALGAAKIAGGGEPVAEIGVEQRLDLALHRVRQLQPVGAEQLDAVVVIGIVRGGDHDAEIAAHGMGEHGDARRRNRAGEQHVHADGQEPGGQRVLDHVAGQARVLADDDAVAVVAAMEDEPSRHADLEGKVRCDGLVGPPADAVSAEIGPGHASLQSPVPAGTPMVIAPRWHRWR